MQLKRDAKVVTMDGDDVGRVDRVVIDPGTRDISHLIIRQGWLFKEDKVLKYDLIDSATETEVRLRASRHDLELDPLPPYQETYFVPARNADSGFAAPLYYYPLGVNPGPVGQPDVYLDPTFVASEKSNIPAESVALKEGARVVSADDEHVGDVDQIITNSDTGRATHFVVESGLLNKEHRYIPYHWVTLVTENEVRLAVSADVIRSLRDQQTLTR